MSVLERMVRAVEKVRQRLLKATAALNEAGLLYAVAGGNAVAAWVASVDEAAVRNTQDVDILLRRCDLQAAKDALEFHGFVFRHAAGIDMFLDHRDAKARDAVHIVFADEKVRESYPFPSPGIENFQVFGSFRVLSLQALVQMKLTSFRDKDRVHLRDLIEMELVDRDWPMRLPAVLGARLQSLLDDPEG